MRIVWYAACATILKCGPFEDQLTAWKAMRLNEKERLRTGREHPEGTYVWPDDTDKSEEESK